MPRLYDLAAEYRAFENRLYDFDGEITEETEDVFEALPRTKEELTAKAENVAKIVRNLEGDALKFDAEIKRLQKRKQVFINNAKRTKIWLKEAMLYAGLRKIEGETLNIGVQNSPPSILDVHINVDGLDKQFCKVVTTVAADKKALLAEYKETGKLPTGVTEVTVGTNLRIR